MKTILFSKQFGNHNPENARLVVHEQFESYKEASAYLDAMLKRSFAEASVNASFE